MIWQHPVMKMNTCRLIRAASLTLCCVPGAVCHPPSAAGPAHSVSCVGCRSVRGAAQLHGHPLHWKSQVNTSEHSHSAFRFVGSSRNVSTFLKLGQFFFFFLMGKYVFLSCISLGATRSPGREALNLPGPEMNLAAK